MNKQRGFTIVELLVVIVVIAILAAITIVAYNGIQQRARDSSIRADLANLSKKLELYNADNGTYPTSNTQAATLAFRFSFSPVSSNVILCSAGGTAYAVLVQQYGKQYKLLSGQGVSEISITWNSSSGAALCANTPYGPTAWGYDFVTGG
jgi:type II secretion system protein G